MEQVVSQKRRGQFLRNAKVMRKRGTARGRRSMVVARTADRTIPLVSLPPIERYRLMAKEECSKTLSENIRVARMLKRKEIVMVHHIVEAMADILQNGKDNHGRRTSH